MYDTHVHSTFSHDGKSKLSEYARLIDEGLIEGIGFSEHVDFMPECGGFDMFDFSSYKSAVELYKDKGCDFHAGAEIDYSKRMEEEIRSYLNENSFDYTICSVHMIDGVSVSDGRNTELFRDRYKLRDMAEKYYFEVKASLKADMFDVIGHMGIYKRYIGDDFMGHRDIGKWAEEVENELARECALSNKIIEVNSSGLFSPSVSTFPSVKFLKAYYYYGGRTLSLGSDAHCTEHVARGFKNTLDILEGIGFEYIVLPWDINGKIRIKQY